MGASDSELGVAGLAEVRGGAGLVGRSSTSCGVICLRAALTIAIHESLTSFAVGDCCFLADRALGLDTSKTETRTQRPRGQTQAVSPRRCE